MKHKQVRLEAADYLQQNQHLICSKPSVSSYLFNIRFTSSPGDKNVLRACSDIYSMQMGLHFLSHFRLQTGLVVLNKKFQITVHRLKSSQEFAHTTFQPSDGF